MKGDMEIGETNERSERGRCSRLSVKIKATHEKGSFALAEAQCGYWVAKATPASFMDS